jgi:hypothetical protein
LFPAKDSTASKLLLLIGAIIFFVIVAMGSGAEHRVSPDSDSYIALAKGQLDQTYAPFSNRILYSLLILAASRVTGLPVEPLFHVAGIVFAAALVAVMMLLIAKFANGLTPQAKGLVALLLVAAPWSVSLYAIYFLPDLLNTVLIGMFFLTFPRHRVWAFIFMFLAFITRESTLVLSAAVVGEMLYEGRLTAGLAPVSISGAATLLVHYTGKFMQPNVHNLSGVTYLIYKVVHHGTRNLLGLDFLSDRSYFYNAYKATAEFHLPDWQIFGGTTTVAFLGFDPLLPVHTAWALWSTFGVVPYIVLMMFVRHGRELFAAMPPAVRIALLYSLLGFVSAPFLGSAVERYVCSAWPVVGVVLPWLLSHARIQVTARLVVAHIVACWQVYLLWFLPGTVSLLASLLMAISAGVYASRLVRQRDLEIRVQAACSVIE